MIFHQTSLPLPILHLERLVNKPPPPPPPLSFPGLANPALLAFLTLIPFSLLSALTSYDTSYHFAQHSRRNEKLYALLLLMLLLLLLLVLLLLFRVSSFLFKLAS